jgi:hypothetical protein
MHTITRVTILLLCVAVGLAIAGPAYAKNHDRKDSVDNRSEEMRYAVAKSAKPHEKYVHRAVKEWDRLGDKGGVNIEEVNQDRCAKLDNCVLYRFEKVGASGVYVAHARGQDTIKIDRQGFRDLSEADRRELLSHETGHALGFNHARCKDRGDSVMVGNCWSDESKPGRYDVREYNKRYR